MFSTLVNLSLLAVLPITTLASHGNSLLNRHQGIARRQDNSTVKRAPDSRWSFYNVETGNAGSCGTFHTNADFTVAMNQAQMNSGWCYKNIRMTYNGKSTVVPITDTCPGCPWNGLDLTEGLFDFFAPASVGIIYGDWEFVDGSGDDSTPTTTKAKPIPTTTTPVWVAPTTTTHKKTTTTTPPPAPTTTKVSKTATPSSSTIPWTTTKASSSSQASSSSTVASSTINYASGVASGLAIPTGTVPSGETSNIVDLYQVFIQIGSLITAGSRV